MFEIPILYLVFNRPDLVEITFQRIKEIKPKYLYIAADGPRESNENDKSTCNECKEHALKNIDWECDVKTLFRENNLGCKYAVSSAIDWFFENVEMGIILEDDVLPDLSFFPFCEELLYRYKDDKRIMHIGGANFQFGIIRGDGDYYYSNISHVWGWATWRRAWSYYDIAMNSFLRYRKRTFFLPKVFPVKLANKMYYYIYLKVFEGEIDTWDYQWQYAINVRKGICVIPNTNLVSNLGFDDRAMHTKCYGKHAEMNTSSITAFKEPSKFAVHMIADKAFLKKEINGNKYLNLLKREICKIIRIYDGKYK